MSDQQNEQIVQAWLQEIASTRGIELSLDINGVCTMLINGLPITLQAAKDQLALQLYAPLIDLPKESLEQAFLLMGKALQLNAFQAHTRGGAIAAVSGEGRLIFCHTLSTEHCNAERLSSALIYFAKTSMELKRQLIDEIEPSFVPQPVKGTAAIKV